jgi:hypothetical protein
MVSPWLRIPLGWVSVVCVVIAVAGFFITLGSAPESDFMTFRASGAALLSGGDLYAVIPPQQVPNLNPPFTALLFVPLAAVSPLTAMVIWESFIVACLVVAIALIGWTLRQPFLATAPLVVLSHPTLAAVAIGQMGIPLLVVLTVAWTADRRKTVRLAGLAIGLAVALKLFVAVLLVALCLRREWRTLAWATIGGGITAVLGVLAAGIDGYRGWFQTLALRAPHFVEFPLNASLPGLVHRNVADPGLANGIWLMSAIVLGLVVVALLWRVRDDVDRSWGIALTAGLLLSPLGWMYYFPILIPALIALWARGSRMALLALLLFIPPVTRSGEWLTITLLVSLAACAIGMRASRGVATDVVAPAL